MDNLFLKWKSNLWTKYILLLFCEPKRSASKISGPAQKDLYFLYEQIPRFKATSLTSNTAKNFLVLSKKIFSSEISKEAGRWTACPTKDGDISPLNLQKNLYQKQMYLSVKGRIHVTNSISSTLARFASGTRPRDRTRTRVQTFPPLSIARPLGRTRDSIPTIQILPWNFENINLISTPIFFCNQWNPKTQKKKAQTII